MAQEELAANRTHQSGLESQTQDLKSGRSLLEQEVTRRDKKLRQQELALKELQKQKGQVKEELDKEKMQDTGKKDCLNWGQNQYGQNFEQQHQWMQTD